MFTSDVKLSLTQYLIKNGVWNTKYPELVPATSNAFQIIEESGLWVAKRTNSTTDLQYRRTKEFVTFGGKTLNFEIKSKSGSGSFLVGYATKSDVKSKAEMTKYQAFATVGTHTFDVPNDNYLYIGIVDGNGEYKISDMWF